MKKKVENDIKRILRLAEKSTLTGNSDLGAGCLPDSGNKDEKVQATSGMLLFLLCRDSWVYCLFKF